MGQPYEFHDVVRLDAASPSGSFVALVNRPTVAGQGAARGESFNAYAVARDIMSDPAITREIVGLLVSPGSAITPADCRGECLHPGEHLVRMVVARAFHAIGGVDDEIAKRLAGPAAQR